MTDAAFSLGTVLNHFIHSFSQHLSSIFHVPGMASGGEDSCELGRVSLRSLNWLSQVPLPSCGVPALQTLITAVGQTVYTVASVLILLFLLMFIFSILGFCLFGISEKGDLENWGNLAMAFFTLFSLATVLCLGTMVRAGASGKTCPGEYVDILDCRWGLPMFRCLIGFG